MTNLQMAFSKGVPSVTRLIKGLRHSFMGEPLHDEGSCPAMTVTVQCARCGEMVSVRVDKANDLLCEFADVDEESGALPAPESFTLHKDVLGRRCQNLMHFTMHFDRSRRVVSKQIEGGQFVEWHDTK